MDMKRYFLEYIKYVETAMLDSSGDFARLKSEMLVQIGFMQHERLIHLIVTFLFAMLLIISIMGLVLAPSVGMIALATLFLLLVIPYVAHYYFLENNVQKLYTLYNKVSELADAQTHKDAQTGEPCEVTEE